MTGPFRSAGMIVRADARRSGRRPLARHLLALCAAGAGAGLALPAHAADRATDEGRCDALNGARFGAAQIVAATFEAERAYSLAAGGAPLRVPAHCEIRGVTSTAPGSAIGFVLWLPTRSAWNGRLQAIGNGGYRGTIGYDELATGMLGGYAMLAGDTGHVTPPGQAPESLAFGNGHPERIADWGRNSIHAITVAAKSIVARVEGVLPHHSYFVGCSTGGHQALTEAQYYPADFDGIVAGAPGNNRTGLNAGFLWRYAVNNRDPSASLTASSLPMIAAAAIKACDGQSGVKDGTIADPASCRFDPATLACPEGSITNCLTPGQIATLKALEADARDPRDGTLIYPAWPLGSEVGWGSYISGPEPARLDYWRGWVMQDPAWSWRSIDWTADLARARARLSPMIDATGTDLSAFVRRGGKMILYQGWADPIGNAYDTIATYRGFMAGGRADAGSVRLFMVPGMGHCKGGAGTDQFDMLAAMEAWTERQIAPDRIVAGHQEGGRIVRTRPLCPFPSKAVYSGHGDPDDAANFSCRV